MPSRVEEIRKFSPSLTNGEIDYLLSLIEKADRMAEAGEKAIKTEDFLYLRDSIAAYREARK